MGAPLPKRPHAAGVWRFSPAIFLPANATPLRRAPLEILLQIWDEMDDWFAAWRQAVKRTLP